MKVAILLIMTIKTMATLMMTMTKTTIMLMRVMRMVMMMTMMWMMVVVVNETVSAGCLFDGSVYAAGDKVVIEPCLAEITCLGQNRYSDITQLGWVNKCLIPNHAQGTP